MCAEATPNYSISSLPDNYSIMAGIAEWLGRETSSRGFQEIFP